MTNDILISCDHVSRKFCKDLKRSLWYGSNTVIGPPSKATPEAFDTVNKIVALVDQYR